MIPSFDSKAAFRVLLLLLMVMNLSPSSAQATLPFQGQTLRLLVVGDPFSLALQNVHTELEVRSGAQIDIEIVSYNDVRRRTLLNARDLQSSYDIISFDVIWVGEYSAAQVLLPLNDHIANTADFDAQDFLQAAYRASSDQGQQLGLPIQPHPELLWYRRDLFDANHVAPPETTSDVLTLAEYFTDPTINRYGICWNGQRGQALGQQMAHFYAAFGQPLLDTAGQPSLDTPRGIAAAEYALALMAWSPPDILNMAWDQRVNRFAQDGCVMTYEWGARAFIVEDLLTSRVRGQVGYSAAPHAPDSGAVTPLGTWSLGIPANIGEREALAWAFLNWLTSAETETLLAENGSGGTPRYSILQNPTLMTRYPFFSLVVELDARNELHDWMRPAIPQWSALADILGTVYHDMLRGTLTPQAAAAQAQQQAEQLFTNP